MSKKREELTRKRRAGQARIALDHGRRLRVPSTSGGLLCDARYFDMLEEARACRERAVGLMETSPLDRDHPRPERVAWIEEQRDGRWGRLGGADGEVVSED
jgi:hypothetical protein